MNIKRILAVIFILIISGISLSIVAKIQGWDDPSKDDVPVESVSINVDEYVF